MDRETFRRWPWFSSSTRKNRSDATFFSQTATQTTSLWKTFAILCLSCPQKKVKIVIVVSGFCFFFEKYSLLEFFFCFRGQDLPKKLDFDFLFSGLPCPGQAKLKRSNPGFWNFASRPVSCLAGDATPGSPCVIATEAISDPRGLPPDPEDPIFAPGGQKTQISEHFRKSGTNSNFHFGKNTEMKFMLR